VRCPRCGNDNPDAMRFCGMCGGTLLSPAPTGSRVERGSPAAPQSSAPATVTATRAPAPMQEPRGTDSSPSISGPSFLGLNEPPTSRKRADLSIDPHRPGSRNLDYLLEEEEHHRGGGAGKFFLIVLALLLAVGLGYLRWKNQLPPWLNSIGKKPAAATTQTADQPPADTSAPAAPSTTPEPQTATSQPAASQPAASAPPANAPAGNQPPVNQPAPTASAATPASPPANSQAPAESSPKADSGNPPDNATASTKNPPASEEASASKNNAPAAKSEEPSDDADSTPAEPASKPKTAPTPAAKPRATIRPTDSIAEARKSLYGKGASQDCDRGLRLLKPMANEGNPKAMVEMGALYSAGLCTPHDLPTAYRWFAMALRKDPSNEAIQGDLQKLWGEMTQPERQLAIKLTQ
jgi:hypothetical protein